MPKITRQLVVIVAAAGLFLFLCYAYCCRLICTKAGYEPGFLVWLPILQLVPLLRAARMSAAWFLLCIIPVLNLVPFIVWCFKISLAREKSAWTGFFLLLPPTSLFAFLYLAASNGKEKETRKRNMSMTTMRLGTT